MIVPLLSASPVNRASSCSILLPSIQSIIFASGNQLALWNCNKQKDSTVCLLFKIHQAEITVVKNLNSHSSAIISGDSIGTVILSILLPDNLKILARLSGHRRSISCLSSIRLPSHHHQPTSTILQHYLILAGASDGSFISWKLSIDPESGLLQHTETIQTFQFGNQIALDAALAFLPNQLTHVILALAVTDGQIAIYSLDLPSLSFSFCFRLPGHTDWVRCLDLTLDPKNSNKLLLVSGSQDNFIRIWRCEQQHHEPVLQKSQTPTSAPTSDVPFQCLDHLTQSLREEAQLTDTSQLLTRHANQQTVEMKRYLIKNTSWSLVSEALLYGHEGWVTNVRWCINPAGTLQLLSTSSDRSMIMWRPSEEFDNIWLNVERFGELANSTNLAFFGAHYFINPHDNSETVLASGWSRAWHRWSKVNNKPVWDPQIAPTAHYGPVTGLDWEKEGDYLATCSADRTTRLWGAWRKTPNIKSNHQHSWHEICRPQVHGHDLFGISFIDDQRTKFVSISEEKVIRVFEMTQDFVKITQELGTIHSPFPDSLDRSRPERAIVPVLGLSNRVQDTTDSDQTPKTSQVTQHSCPPFEDQLLSRTLWPEIDKIYGHPSELSTITTSHCGKIIASACHANSAQSASIRLHNSTGNLNLIQSDVLEAHQLTVTKLAFNADDSQLLSVSRDRSWTIWKRIGDRFEMENRFEKAHARVIWDASWAPPSLHSSNQFFVTGSRDKSVKTWSKSIDSQSDPIQLQKNNWTLSNIIKCDQPVKSCDISPFFFNHDQMLLAIGLEDGCLSLYTGKHADDWQCFTRIDLTTVYHEGAINKISFYPKNLDFDGDKDGERARYRLATGGEDGVVKIFDLIFSTL